MRYFLMLVVMVLISTTEGVAQSSPQLPRQLITLENSCQLELIQEIDGGNGVLRDIQTVTFDSSGNYLAFISRNSVVVWNISEQQIIWRLPVFYGNNIVFGANSNLAIAANGSLYLWDDISDINSWIELKDEIGNPLGWVGDLAFTPNDNELIVVSGGKYRVIRYGLKDINALYLGEETFENEFDNPIKATISTDGQAAAILKASNGMFFVDIETGDLLGRPDALTIYTSHIKLLTFTNDSENPYLLINEQDESGLFISKLVISDITGEIISTYEYDFEVVWTQADFNPVNNLLVLANAVDGKLYFYGEDYSETACTLDSLEPEMVTALAFSADGTLLASGGADGTVRLWGIPAGE